MLRIHPGDRATGVVMVQEVGTVRQEAAPMRTARWWAPRRARAVWALLAVAVLGAIVLVAAYQVRPTYRLTVGDAPHDRPLIGNFNQPERQPAQFGGRRFRWTRDDGTIAFPGIGRQAVAVDITLAGSNN